MRWPLCVALVGVLALGLAAGGPAFGQDPQEAERQRQAEAERSRQQQQEQQQRAEQQRQAEAQRAAEAERSRQQQEQQRAEQQRQSEAQRAADAQRTRQQQEQQRAEQQRQAEAQRAAESQRTRQQQEQQRAEQQRLSHAPRAVDAAPQAPQSAPRPAPQPSRTAPTAGPAAVPARPAAPPASIPQPRRPNPAAAPQRPMNPAPGNPAARPASGGISPSRAPLTPSPRPGGPAYVPPPAGSVASALPGGGLALNSGGSGAVLDQVNRARGGMPGVNRRALPPGQVTIHASGGLTLNAGLRRYELRRDGTLAAYSANGRSALFRPDGQVRSLRTPDLDIRRYLRGERVIIGHRPDHSALVATGGRGGYLERTFPIGDRTFIERTYVRNGIPRPRFFRPYPFHGLHLPAYIPRVYYPAAFYRWLTLPWARRAIYPWTWIDQQWYRFYVHYFTPALYYSDSDLWLADYVLSDTLESGYEDGASLSDATGAAELEPPPGADTGDEDELYSDRDYPIGDELKADLATEVGGQLDDERAMSGGDEDPTRVDLPAWLKPNRLFIVSQSLQAAAGQRGCELSHGDVLRLIASPAPDSVTAVLKVVASKRGDCPVDLEVSLSLADLQEMLDDFRARLDAGLDALRSGQGQNGLPAAPRAALTPVRPGLANAPAADSGVPALLAEQRREADQAEAGILDIALPAQPPGQ